MIEIALCLGIIGFALVAIIGILPTGMQVQKDNRQDTIINQDATYLIDAICSGARGADDLTNYVDAITNTVTVFNSAGGVLTPATANGYTRNTPFALTNGARIIGLLSTPKYQPFGSKGFVNSNHVVAYLRAISGSAVEKATNADARSFAFSYRVTPEIIPYTFFDPSKTNLALPGSAEERRARTNFWLYAKNQQANLYEVRLLFRWPLQANGIVGDGRQIFRTTVAGGMTNDAAGSPLFFFKPRSYDRIR
jgi:hypothetical protein